MQRTTNNIGGDGGEKTSVKVHYAPGGKSSFSLGWGNDETAPVQKNISRKYNNQSSIFGGPEDKKTPFEEKNQVASIRVNHAPGGQSSIIFGDSKPDYPKTRADAPKTKENITPGIFDSQPPTQAKSSIRVHNPPGGKSSITFA